MATGRVARGCEGLFLYEVGVRGREKSLSRNRPATKCYSTAISAALHAHLATVLMVRWYGVHTPHHSTRPRMGRSSTAWPCSTTNFCEVEAILKEGAPWGWKSEPDPRASAPPSNLSIGRKSNPPPNLTLLENGFACFRGCVVVAGESGGLLEILPFGFLRG